MSEDTAKDIASLSDKEKMRERVKELNDWITCLRYDIGDFEEEIRRAEDLIEEYVAELCQIREELGDYEKEKGE